VMLHTPDGKEETIRRDNIVTLRPMTTSLMPEGLEVGLTKQDIADLLEYLKNGKSTEAK
jgi:putative heme-binding domain-containing protein